MKDSQSERLIIAQSGREHPYEGISTKRATFWIRVMQLLGVETLIGANASGILTPETIKQADLVLVHSDLDFGDDNPLIGLNEDGFGPRFPHMGDLYPLKTREMVKKVARENSIDLGEGMYVRVKGPNYERAEDVYKLRGLVRQVWEEGSEQALEIRFRSKPTAVVGMSSTYEQIVAQHATQSEKNPAFQRGRAYITVATNYAAALTEKGFVESPTHEEVKEIAAKVENNFNQLVRSTIEELRKES